MAVKAQEVTDRYAIYNGDSITLMAEMPAESVGFSIYSPPFANEKGGLYHYSSSDHDLSNSVDYRAFFEHYEFIVRGITRITMPGRMTAVHCTDVPTGNSGCDGLQDFPGDIIRLHERHGWSYVMRYHIWKEPLAVRLRTMAKGLAHATLVEDSTKVSGANADYLLIFRRKGENRVPVRHPIGLLEYAGSLPVPAELLKLRGWTGKQTENRYSHWIWRRYADAFWDDIRIDRVLPYREAKEEEDERHVHPLQLDVIDRGLVLYSNPGEVVFTPCMGVGSEVWSAVRNGRIGVGAELKTSYYRQAVANLRTVDRSQPEQAVLLEDAAATDGIRPRWYHRLAPDLIGDEPDAA
jgi:hypothetical protein